jgi:hypothetical protein
VKTGIAPIKLYFCGITRNATGIYNPTFIKNTANSGSAAVGTLIFNQDHGNGIKFVHLICKELSKRQVPFHSNSLFIQIDLKAKFPVRYLLKLNRCKL